MIADLIGARKEARRRKRVWEEWAIREFGGVGIAYNNPNVTFSKVDDMFKGMYILSSQNLLKDFDSFYLVRKPLPVFHTKHQYSEFSIFH